MDPDFPAHALLECVRRYYPSGLTREDPGYEASEEIQRLRLQLRSAASDTGSWQRFIQEVEETFSGCEVSDRSPLPHGPSYRCQVALPVLESPLDRTREEVVVCMLSVLAPVYALYASHLKDDGTERESWTRYPPLPLEFQSHEARLATLIETTLGATRLPNEVLFTPVPGLLPLRGGHPQRAPWLVEFFF